MTFEPPIHWNDYEDIAMKLGVLGNLRELDHAVITQALQGIV